MTSVVLASFVSFVFGWALALVAVFMILLVLVQRGRGGGLAGALGGMGGSSAFGAKAGDVFTRITAWTALVWMVLCLATTKWGAASQSQFGDDPAPPTSGEQVETHKGGDAKSATTTDAAAAKPDQAASTETSSTKESAAATTDVEKEENAEKTGEKK